MKIRNGFVSNSSSSSFVMIGFSLSNKSFDNESILKFMFGNQPDVKKLLDRIKLPKEKIRCCKHPETDNKYCPECGKPMWQEIEIDWAEEISILLEDKLEKLGICRRDHIINNESAIGYELISIHEEGGKAESINLAKITENLEKIRSDLGLKSDYPVKIFNYTTSG